MTREKLVSGAFKVPDYLGYLYAGAGYGWAEFDQDGAMTSMGYGPTFGSRCEPSGRMTSPRGTVDMDAYGPPDYDVVGYQHVEKTELPGATRTVKGPHGEAFRQVFGNFSCWEFLAAAPWSEPQ